MMCGSRREGTAKNAKYAKAKGARSQVEPGTLDGGAVGRTSIFGSIMFMRARIAWHPAKPRVTG
jgi:hypothetical protein